jgi:hypothetical protein
LIKIYHAPVFSRIGISLSNFDGEIIPNLSSLKPRKNELNDFTLKFDLTAVFENKDEMDAGLQIKTVKTKLLQENGIGAVTDFEKFGGSISLYGKYRFLRFEKLGIDIGTRFNATGLNDKSGGVFEPRISLTYRFVPSVAFKAAWGVYIQQLVTITDEDEIISVFDPWMIIPDYLNPSKSIHYNAGIEIDFTKGISFTAEAYYKTFKDIPVVNDQKYFSLDPDFVSASAESYGLELGLKYGINPVNISTTYTLSWVYKNINNWIYYPSYDNRHALNVMLEYNLGNGWTTSSVFSFNSGYPFTELLGFYDKYFSNNFNHSGIGPDDYSPYLITGDRNLGRLPVYHRLDMSLTKKLRLFFTDVEIGVSAINVYNRKNLFYYDRSTGEEVNMLPFLLTGTLKIQI